MFIRKLPDFHEQRSRCSPYKEDRSPGREAGQLAQEIAECIGNQTPYEVLIDIVDDSM